MITIAKRCYSHVQAQVEESSASLPGIPPSSLSSFLRANASIAGVVLTEFDGAFTNPYYNSRFDTEVQQQGIVAAAIVVARALHSIAVNGTGVEPLKVRFSKPPLIFPLCP